MKSVRTCPLLAVLGSYLMLYEFSYVAHFGIRPVAFEFLMMLRQYGNQKKLEVMSQLFRHKEKSESQIFHHLIPGLGSGQ